jgi:hypothetical protein
MWRWLCLTWTAAVAFVAGGCATGPLQDNPLAVRTETPLVAENPVYVPVGLYPLVFQKVLDVVDDYFPIAYASRPSGTIESYPVIAPGLEQPWKPGSPDFYQRTMAFFQTIQHRAIVHISVADDGGFFVDVKVLKELEDLPNPAHYTGGAATFITRPTVERQYEVIDGGQYLPNWIPIGRDYKLEQVILSRIAQFDIAGMRKTAAATAPAPVPSSCPPAPHP